MPGLGGLSEKLESAGGGQIAPPALGKHREIQTGGLGLWIVAFNKAFCNVVGREG
jgi:hypothetical protein